MAKSRTLAKRRQKQHAHRGPYKRIAGARVITESLVKASGTWEGQRHEIHDSLEPGFVLRVGITGTVSYTIVYHTNEDCVRRRRQFVVGTADKTEFATAVLKAEQTLAAVRQGKDPQSEKTTTRKAAKRKQARTLRAFLQGEDGQAYFNLQKSGDASRKRLQYACASLLDRDMSTLVVLDIERWRRQRLKVAGNTTVDRDWTTLRALINEAVRLNVLDHNPVKVKVLSKPGEGSRVRYLSPEERKRLDKALPSAPGYLRVMTTVALNTGMRRGELFDLKWEDVDLAAGRLTLRDTKNGKARHLRLNKNALPILRAWKPASDAIDRVFPGDRGKRMSTVKRSWASLMKAADLEDFRFHDCRHDFASQLVMKGIDLNTVRELLGHADMKMTLKYAHLAPKHLADAVEALA